LTNFSLLLLFENVLAGMEMIFLGEDVGHDFGIVAEEMRFG
jgi:hypothetical protein